MKVEVVEFQYTIKGRYKVPLDGVAMDGYGTLDPEKMAEVDLELLKEDPGSFTHDISEAKIEIVEKGS